MKKFLTLFCFALALALFATAHASAATYYFNNAVNTDPTELGNYFNDYGATDPATVLPDNNIDEVVVVSGATYDGDAVFNGTAYNEGTVTGNAIFNGSESQNFGTVNGTKIRYFKTDTAVNLDFVSTGPWTVVADGALITTTSATIDETTTLQEINGGHFAATIRPILGSVSASGNTIILPYGFLDTGSIPVTNDYSVTVNGVVMSVSNVGIVDNKIILTLASTLAPSDVVKLTYTAGSNPVRSSLYANALNFSDRNIPTGIFLGEDYSPTGFSTTVGVKVYVTNSEGYISVIDTVTDTVLTTISVDSLPRASAAIGNKLYVIRSDGYVSVIDMLTNTVSATIAVGANPRSIIIAGTKAYVTNGNDGTVSVIDTSMDTVADTIPVGNLPLYAVIAGTKLYVSNFNDNNVSVIDTETDTVIATILVGDGANYSVVAGSYVYVANANTDTVSVINTETDTIETTLTVGISPYYFAVAGTKVYVSTSENSGSVAVIDTTSNSVTDTIDVEDNPFYLVLAGRTLYVNNMDSNSVSVIDTETDTVVDTLSVGEGPIFSLLSGDSVYVTTSNSHLISIINTTTLPSLLPNLTSFSTPSPSGTYTPSQSIPITAHFGRTLSPGSTMTVLLNSGSSVTLSSVSGSTLSGTYTIGSDDHTPDLAISSITAASVSDGTHTRTSYDLPSSQGSLVAENSFITRNLGDSVNITIGSYQTIDTGTNPYQISAPVNGFLYVANQGSNTVSVINQSTNAVVHTIPVGSEPYGLSLAGSSLYVANTGSNTVSVIDTATNTVISTIPVGIHPYYVATIGTNVYVTNGSSNTVSVISSLTDTVTDTIAVGSYPRGIKAHGTDLYVANYGDPNYSGGNSVSVINSLTNTVSDTIIMPAGVDGPRGVTVLGSKVYVANFRSNNVSVIDTNTDDVIDTIAVGTGPRGIVGLGTNIYVENFDDGTISVIDTDTDTVTDTVTVGSSPSGMSVVGTDIYLTSFQDNRVYILDTLTNTLRAEEEEESDTTPPSTTLSVSSTTGSIGIFTFTSDEDGTFECSLDDASYTACTSPYTTDTLAPGSHTFAVRAIDTSNNTDLTPATFSWTVTAPSSGGGSHSGGGSGGSISLPVTCIEGQLFSPLTGKKCTVFTPKTTPPVLPSPYRFTRSLSFHMTGDDVRQLQIYLNTHDFPVSPVPFPGSLGHETTLFGAATRAALVKFQKAHQISPAVGYFGPVTRGFVEGHN